MVRLPTLKPGDVVIRRFPSGSKQLERVRSVQGKTVCLETSGHGSYFHASTGNGTTDDTKSQRIYVDAGEIVSMQIRRAAKGK
jgi:hypothetical protein